MTDLSRNLLAAARDGMSPSPDVMARVRAKVAASAAAAATGSVAAIPAKAATGLGAKLAIGALVAAAITAGVVVLTAQHSSPNAASIAPRASEAELPAAIHSSTGVREQPAPAVKDTARAAAPVTGLSLAREVELIDAAMKHIADADYRGALDAIATFDRESHGHGQMAEDAAAIDIEARCRLHENVGQRLARFDRSWPSSAQRSRLQSLCY